jgi:hypothetical protein
MSYLYHDPFAARDCFMIVGLLFYDVKANALNLHIVTELSLSGLVRVQPGKRIIIMCVAKGFNSLTPLHKETGNPLIGETGGLNRALGRVNCPTVCKFET